MTFRTLLVAVPLVLASCAAPVKEAGRAQVEQPSARAEPECHFDSDCPGVGACLGGRCSAGSRPCSSDLQCGTGSCSGGLCSPVPRIESGTGSCTTDLDCVAGRRCAAGTCQ